MADATRAHASPIVLAHLCACEAASTRATAAQAGRLQHHVDDFVALLAQLGVPGVRAISASICESFVRSPSSSGSEPSARLMGQRRTSLRFVFRLARAVGLLAIDPTVDLVLPPRAPSPPRPLTDAEVSACRSVSFWDLGDTRRAAAWAAAEATARSSELAHLRMRDVDVKSGRVWIHGGKTTTDRWGHLTEWGCTQIARRLEAVGDQPDLGLVYQGRSPAGAGQVASCTAVVDVLQRAGLAGLPRVRPGSVAAWAGRQILSETGRIDIVAQRLGMTSLDRVARLIECDWQGKDSQR